MAQKRIKAKGRRENGTYVGIPHAITRSREYATLSASAVKLFIDLADQFNGVNNGDLQATWPFMERKGWRSKATLYRAINELLDRGFIIVSRQGGRHKCTLYALTFLAIDDCKGKLDIAETRVPPNIWKTNSVVQKRGQFMSQNDPLSHRLASKLYQSALSIGLITVHLYIYHIWALPKGLNSPENEVLIRGRSFRAI